MIVNMFDKMATYYRNIKEVPDFPEYGKTGDIDLWFIYSSFADIFKKPLDNLRQRKGSLAALRSETTRPPSRLARGSFFRLDRSNHYQTVAKVTPPSIGPSAGRRSDPNLDFE